MSGAYVSLAVGVNALTGGAITNALGFGGSSGGGGGGNSGLVSGSGSSTQQAADPFAPYRANLGGLYAGALQPGASTDITKMPGYSQFETGVLDPALEASKRSAASSGMLRSGNEQIALEKTAEKGYYGFMTDYLNRLAQGSGAVNNPATAAALGVNQGNINDAATMQGLGATVTALKDIYNSNYNSNVGYGGGITSSGMYNTGYTDVYSSDGGTIPLGYVNF